MSILCAGHTCFLRIAVLSEKPESNQAAETISTACGLTIPHNLAYRLIFPQPDKPRLPQVTIRRPFGGLDLREQLGTDDELGLCLIDGEFSSIRA